MKSTFKFSLCALAIGAVFASPASYAQQNQAQAEADKVERIQVTGSRISRTDMEGASPVEVISRDDIEASGFNNLQQLLLLTRSLILIRSQWPPSSVSTYSKTALRLFTAQTLSPAWSISFYVMTLLALNFPPATVA